MPTAQSSLTITELGEISFVDKGDNPPAKVAILKSAPSTPGAPVENTPAVEAVSKAEYDAIRKQMEEQAAKIAKMEEEKAFGATEAFCKSAGLDVAKLAPHIRAIEKAAPEAAEVLKAEMAQLAKGLEAAVRLNGGQIAGVGKAAGTDAASALQQFNELVAKAEATGLPYSVAVSKVANENPELYRTAGG